MVLRCHSLRYIMYTPSNECVPPFLINIFVVEKNYEISFSLYTQNTKEHFPTPATVMIVQSVFIAKSGNNEQDEFGCVSYYSYMLSLFINCPCRYYILRI